MTPRLLIAAHGTRSSDGVATIAALADLVRAARPELHVDVCFLDVIEPSLQTVLAGSSGPVVIVPALLSTGYHVVDDIPSVVGDRRDVRVSAHLGPDPLLTAALVDRLTEADGQHAATVLLAASGSSNPSATDDLTVAGDDLARALHRPVRVVTMTDESTAPGDLSIATYLLADGYFAGRVRDRAAAAGITAVAAPIGAHPAIAELIVRRYDETLATP